MISCKVVVSFMGSPPLAKVSSCSVSDFALMEAFSELSSSFLVFSLSSASVSARLILPRIAVSMFLKS